MAVRRTNGEGCYVNMPSGKIQMRKQCGFLANGRPRVLSVTGKSRAECNRLMKEKEAKVTGIVSMAKDSTVEELCRCHLSSQMAQRDRLKPTAIDRREGTINQRYREPYREASCRVKALGLFDREGLPRLERGIQMGHLDGISYIQSLRTCKGEPPAPLQASE